MSRVEIILVTIILWYQSQPFIFEVALDATPIVEQLHSQQQISQLFDEDRMTHILSCILKLVR